MSSSGMLRHVTLGRTNVSEDCITSNIRVTKISELGTLAVTINRHTAEPHACWLLVTANVVPSSSILVTLMMEALGPHETSVLNKSYMA
jgi:hypothetical protein